MGWESVSPGFWKRVMARAEKIERARKIGKPTARARPTLSATAQWRQAVESAKAEHPNNPAMAIRAANVANPGLRAKMLKEVNASRPSQPATPTPTARATPAPKAYQRSFAELVDELVSQGMDRPTAARRINAEHPGLRQAFVAQANQGR